MIKSLLIGTPNDISKYTEVISQLRYFEKPVSINCNEGIKYTYPIDTSSFDAIMLVSNNNQSYIQLKQAIKEKANIYYTDQKSINDQGITELLTLHSEANNLLFPEIRELHHPLVQEFISTNPNQLMFRYNKTIQTKQEVRRTLLNALSFITILSPMQVKKIDINSIDASNLGRPAFKIRLKLYDSSLAYIFLRFGKKNDHNIIIESKTGNFTFNFTENYLENVHGTRFNCEIANETDLIRRALEAFALCIILNKKPQYNFYHYTLTILLISKIENIILGNF